MKKISAFLLFPLLIGINLLHAGTVIETIEQCRKRITPAWYTALTVGIGLGSAIYLSGSSFANTVAIPLAAKTILGIPRKRTREIIMGASLTFLSLGIASYAYRSWQGLIWLAETAEDVGRDG